MKIIVELELSRLEMATICSNSIERVLNNAIHIGGEAELGKPLSEGDRERASTLWQDCEELKPITTKLWGAVHNQIFKDKGV